MHDTRSKNTYTKTERASAELRRGGHIMLRLNSGEAALFCGAEFANGDDVLTLSGLAGSGPLLVLTENRVKSLGRSLRENWPVATIALAKRHFDHVFDLAFGQASLDNEVSIVAEQTGSLADHAARLLRNTKLLPAALMSRIPFRDIAAQDRFALEHNLLNLEARDLGTNRPQAHTVMRIAARANVP